MFQLESSDDLGRKLVFPLVKVMTTVGRDPNCDIVLADDDVSRRHAKIYLMGGMVKIKDENSVNGTFINNVRITEMTTVPLNAELIFGSNQFFLRQVAGVVPEDLRLTSVLSIDQLRDMTIDYQSLLDDVPPEGPDMAKTTVVDKQEILENIYLKKINFRVYPTLEVIFGIDRGRKYVLVPGADHRLGRGENCNIRLNDTMVSSVHGSIEVGPDEVVYTDEGSRNGSILNNKIVQTHPLKHGDVLVLGNTKLKFTHPEQARRSGLRPVAGTRPVDEGVNWAKYALWAAIGLAGAGLIAAVFYVAFAY